MKKGILLYCEGSKSWIGGVYYIKNVAYQLATNPDISSKYNIHLLIVNAEVFDDFLCVLDKVKIHVLTRREKKNLNIFIRLYSFIHRITCIYPKTAMEGLQFDNVVAWVPDFQECRLPDMFSEEEKNIRIERYKSFATSKFPLMLSSNDSKKDFFKYISSEKKNVYVMPFVSYIEQEINGLSDKYVSEIVEKYKINKKFVLVSNQFWKHKNHIVVLQAIDLLLKRKEDISIQFVFTGQPKDDRNPGYIEEILRLLNKNEISSSVRMVGFVGRMEQLALMKACQFVVQPSLFEGWGTVLEDAKVLDKRVVLSDIPVHREQMNDRCVLFNPYSPESLIDAIKKLLTYEKDDCIEKGIRNMQKSALCYSNGFYEMLKEMSK